jgi:hypothetical protein
MNRCGNLQWVPFVEHPRGPDFIPQFDDNEMPDIYNGLMYFRYSQTAAEFFWYAGQIFKNWTYVRDSLLKNCRDEDPTTDVVYALTAKILGVDRCKLPSMDYNIFVHMNPAINDVNRKWETSLKLNQQSTFIRNDNFSDRKIVGELIKSNRINRSIANSLNDKSVKSKHRRLWN